MSPAVSALPAIKAEGRCLERRAALIEQAVRNVVPRLPYYGPPYFWRDAAVALANAFKSEICAEFRRLNRENR